MPLMLPSLPSSARSVVGVADDLLGALRGESTHLPPARSAVLVVIDGLGSIALRAHSGHARTLAGAMAKRDIASSVFPSTTASALTSILTGAWPGEHGLVGYRVRDPRRDALFNQLSDWEKAGIDPATWQASPTMFERAQSEGRRAFAVGVREYAGTGFTRAVLRGAEFVPEGSPERRVERAYDLAAEHGGSVVYCYLPEVDKAGHKHGMASPQWVAALESVDAAFAHPVPAGVGVLVTSDHGMIDVPAHRHVIVQAGDPCLDGVRHVGGEPRMLHVYLEPDIAPEEAAERWQRSLGAAADVITRRQAIDAGLLGPRVTDAAAERLGDLLVAARGNRAVYDGTAADQKSQAMIGQHGSLTPEERSVPLVRFGAFA